ncbi:MAG: alkaline phosphatase family protein [Firmicutes bacterium]|nr:alkaline phosphatase family protein [Bacillota bacterium]
MKICKPDYQNSILNVSNSLLHYYGISTPYHGISILDQELQKKYNHIVYILLDGLGVNLLREHLSVDDALLKYLRKEITSVFPPTTVAATDAVISGVPPISNGHLGWVQYFPNEDVNVVVFRNEDFYDEKNILTENLRDKYLSFERIHDKIAQANPNVKTFELFPSFREGGSESFASEIEKVLAITANTDQSFSYVYWIQPDIIEHQAGINSDEVKNTVRQLNQDFEELIEEINDDTLVICIADHGLIDVLEMPLFKHKDIMSMLVRNPSFEPRATNFFVKPEFIHDFRLKFNEYFSQYFKLYSKQEILDSKLFGEGIQHSMIDGILGDYIAIAIDIYMFTLNDEKVYKAHHAGLSEAEMMVPLIFYSKK